MYPMAGMYPTQDMTQMANQAQNYMANYPLYNMPPPTNIPPMTMMPPVAGHDQQNVQHNFFHRIILHESINNFLFLFLNRKWMLLKPTNR